MYYSTYLLFFVARHLDHGQIDNEFDLTLGHYVEMCSKLGIILDFDGTLSPLARTPELAFIPPETKKVLERLVKYCAEFTHFFSFLKAISRIFTFLNFRLVNLPDVHVVVISGREVENLRAKVGVDGLTYAGNHGLHVMHADGQMYQHTIPQVNFKFPLSFYLVHEEI